MWIGTPQGVYLGADRRSLLIIAAAGAAPATAAASNCERGLQLGHPSRLSRWNQTVASVVHCLYRTRPLGHYRPAAWRQVIKPLRSICFFSIKGPVSPISPAQSAIGRVRSSWQPVFLPSTAAGYTSAHCCLRRRAGDEAPTTHGTRPGPGPSATARPRQCKQGCRQGQRSRTKLAVISAQWGGGGEQASRTKSTSD